MMRTRYTFLAEPCGDIYRDLIDALAHYCRAATLVVRGHARLNAKGRAVLDALAPYLLEVRQAHSWPGTVLFDETADVYRYQINRSSVSILKHSAPRLFAWLQPDRPEDLCMYQPTGEAILVTIAHERDGYIQCTDDALRFLVDQVPGLTLNLDAA